MGKVICLINTTADGFVDSHYVIADAAFHEFVHVLLKETKTVAFGRNTFELFQEVWPSVLEKADQPASQVKMATALHNINKVVFSKTLQQTKWHNSSISTLSGHEVNLLMDTHQNLLTIGSPGIVAALTESDLVDEYYFSVQPTVAGHGQVRLFDKISLENKRPLKLIDTTTLNSGVVIIHYQVVKAGNESIL